MQRANSVFLSMLLASAATLAVSHTTPAAADDATITDDDNPELRVVSIVHGMSFTLNQHEVVPTTQGPTTMVTHVHTLVPPGPPQINNVVPPGPPNIDLVVRLTAPDMEIAHAAGALTALGLMQGMSLQQITNTFAQLDWAITIKSVKGQVDPNSVIDPAKASTLAELTIAAIIAGDRPGGGCDAAIPFIQQGAAALGFAPTCALPNQTN